MFRLWLESQHAWDRSSAQAFISKISPLLKKAGYNATIVGGVATNGHSDHDLDLLMNSVRDDGDFEEFYRWFPNHVEGSFDHGGVEMNVLQVTLPDGRIVDFLFPME
jgi:hypothetical protein